MKIRGLFQRSMALVLSVYMLLSCMGDSLGGINLFDLLGLGGDMSAHALVDPTSTAETSHIRTPDDGKPGTVIPTNPTGVTVNFFDYWLTEQGAEDFMVLTYPNYNDGGNYWRNNVATKGINKDHLLLFAGSYLFTDTGNTGSDESGNNIGKWNVWTGNGRYGPGGGNPQRGISYDNRNLNDSKYRDGMYKPHRGIVAQVLGNDGYPKLALGDASYINNRSDGEYGSVGNQFTDTGYFNTVFDPNYTKAKANYEESLDYLFAPVDDKNNGKAAYPNVTGLFMLDERGYYVYNSNTTFAELNIEQPITRGSNGTYSTKTSKGTNGENHVTLYDAPWMWYNTNGADNTNTTDIGAPMGQFFPFNDWSELFNQNGNNVTQRHYSMLAAKNDTGHSNNPWTGDQSRPQSMNHYFGMTLTSEFKQPVDGKVKLGVSTTQDMMFEFSGDDDVWIFVDGVLVGDVGGVHNAVKININFATGAISYSSLIANYKGTYYSTSIKAMFEEAGMQDSVEWRGNTFADNTLHTLSFFYLERGNDVSNCSLTYNLQPVEVDRIRKVDQNGNTLSAQDGVSFKLYEAKQNAGDNQDGEEGKVKYNTDYNWHYANEFTTVKDQNGADVLVTNNITYDDDGYFKLVNSKGEAIQFADYSTEYFILREETTPAGYRVNQDIVLQYQKSTGTFKVVNKYETGAYASFVANWEQYASKKPTYATFASEDVDSQTGGFNSTGTAVEADTLKKGLTVVVPVIKENGQWLPLYGSNTTGWNAIAADSGGTGNLKTDLLAAALLQIADDQTQDWFLRYKGGLLIGSLPNLPGDATRYLANNQNGPENADMHLVTVFLPDEVLVGLGLAKYDDGGFDETKILTDDEKLPSVVRYGELKIKLSGSIGNSLSAALSTAKDYVDSVSLLNADDSINRLDKTVIYVPNEVRELRVRKVDNEGGYVNGAVFAIFNTPEDAKAFTTKFDSTDAALKASGTGMLSVGATGDYKLDSGEVHKGTLIFREVDAKPGGTTVTKMDWPEDRQNAQNTDRVYWLKEIYAPEGYEKNPNLVRIEVGNTAIYANATGYDLDGKILQDDDGHYDLKKNDGIRVYAGAGKLVQTLVKYAMDNHVDITLRDITIYRQDNEGGANGDLAPVIDWDDTKPAETFNLHYNVNSDHLTGQFGLHNADLSDKDIQERLHEAGYPVFIAEDGYVRAMPRQNNTDAYKEDAVMTAHKDDLTNPDENGTAKLIDLSGLFTLLEVVEVKDPLIPISIEISKEVKNPDEIDISGDTYSYAIEFDASTFNSDALGELDKNGYLIYHAYIHKTGHTITEDPDKIPDSGDEVTRPCTRADHAGEDAACTDLIVVRENGKLVGKILTSETADPTAAANRKDLELKDGETYVITGLPEIENADGSITPVKYKITEKITYHETDPDYGYHVSGEIRDELDAPAQDGGNRQPKDPRPFEGVVAEGQLNTLDPNEDYIPVNVVYVNEPMTDKKTEKTPGDDKLVGVGSVVDYDITWLNDSSNTADVTIADKLDKGVDFKEAALKIGDEEVKLTMDMVKAGTTSIESKATVKVDDQDVPAVKISYDEVNRTVTWLLKARGAGTFGTVQLAVVVNDKAPYTWSDNDDGTITDNNDRDRKIENRARVTANGHTITTEPVVNYVPDKEETEITRADNTKVSVTDRDGTHVGPLVQIGDTITYKIYWKNDHEDKSGEVDESGNAGPDGTANVTITDPITTGLEFVSASFGGKTLNAGDDPIDNDNFRIEYTAGKVIWTLKNRAAQSDAESDGYVTVTVRVTKDVLTGHEVTNQASVQVGEDQVVNTPKIENPEADKTETGATGITGAFKVETKDDGTVIGPVVDKDSVITYEIRYKNSEDKKVRVLITDKLDPGLDFESASYKLDENTTVTLTKDDLATITPDGEGYIVKTGGDPTEYEGKPVPAVVTVKYNPDTRTVIWILYDRPADTADHVVMQAKVNENAKYGVTKDGAVDKSTEDKEVRNNATVQVGGSVLKTNDVVNNTPGNTTVSIAKSETVYQSVSKDDDGNVTYDSGTTTAGKDPLTVKPGDKVTYTLTVKNEGNVAAKDVIVSDAIPVSGAIAMSKVNPDGANAQAWYLMTATTKNAAGKDVAVEGAAFSVTEDGKSLVWNLGDLAVGQEVTLTFTVIVPEVTGAATWDNVALASAENDPGDPDDPDDPEDNGPHKGRRPRGSNVVETETGILVVSKIVHGADEGDTTAFGFSLELTVPQDAEGKDLVKMPGTVTMVFKAKDGKTTEKIMAVLESGIINFALHDGESVTFKGLPQSIKYVVTELTPNTGYTTTVTGGTTDNDKKTSSGAIPETGSASAVYDNYKEKDNGKTVNKKTTGVGEVLVYTITWNNNTPNEVDVTVTDVLQKGLTFISASPAVTKTEAAENGGTKLTWELGTKEALEQGTITVKVLVNEDAFVDGEISNEANVKNGHNPDFKVGPAKTTPLKGNLEVSKTVAGLGGDKSKDFTFKVKLYYAEQSEDGRAEVLLTGSYDYERTNGTPASGKLTPDKDGWYVFTLKHNEKVTIKNLPANTKYKVVEVEANEDGYVTTSEGTEGTIVADKTASASFVNSKKADRDQLKTEVTPGADKPVKEGDYITYEIYWTNDNLQTAEVVITDPLDPGVNFEKAKFGASDDTENEEWYTSNTPVANISYANHTVTWTIPEAEAESNGVVTLVVRVNDKAKTAGHVDNEATVTINNDPKPTNKVENPVPTPKKEEVTPGANKPAQVGEIIEYTISWQNYKKIAATVKITDKLDPGVDYVSCDNGGSYDESTRTVTWTLENREPNTEGKVTLRVRVTAAALADGKNDVENTASVQVDNDPAIDTDTIWNPVPDPKKEEVTPGDGKHVMVGDPITYTISWRNYQKDEATVTITDRLDPGVTYVDSSDGGEYDSSTHTVTWNLGTKAAGASGKVTLEVVVNENAEFTWNYDEPTLDDSVNDQKVFNQGRVKIGDDSEIKTNIVENKIPPYKTEAKPGEDTAVQVGDEITYSIYWKNYESEAAEVTITDYLDDGVDYVSCDNGGQYDAENHVVVWELGEQESNAEGYVQLTVLVNERAQQGWAYGNAGTGDATGAEDNKVVNKAGVEVGNSGVEYTNTVQNPIGGGLTVSKTVTGTGGSTSQSFAFKITLDDTTINGTYGDIFFKDGVAEFSLKHGQSKTAKNLPAGIGYTVEESNNDGYTVTSSGETGKIPANSTTTAGFENHKDKEIFDPAIEISKTQSVNGGAKTTELLQVAEGDIVTYYLTVKSTGTTTAKNIIVSDKIPEGLTLSTDEGAISDGGTLASDGKTIVWTLGDLEPGADYTVSFKVIVPPVSETTRWLNVAYASNDDPNDPPEENPDPNDPHHGRRQKPSNEVEIEEPVKEPHVSVVKEQAVNGGTRTTAQRTVKAGDKVTYYLTVTSDGKDMATDIVLTDVIPDGLSLVKGSITDGGILSSDGKTIVWYLGDMETGTSITVSFTVTVPSVAGTATWKNVTVVSYEDPSDPTPENPDPDDPHKGRTPKPSNEVVIVESTVPQTGDNGNMALWLTLLAVSGAALGLTAVKGKTRKERRAK